MEGIQSVVVSNGTEAVAGYPVKSLGPTCEGGTIEKGEVTIGAETIRVQPRSAQLG